MFTTTKSEVLGTPGGRPALPGPVYHSSGWSEGGEKRLHRIRYFTLRFHHQRWERISGSAASGTLGYAYR